MGRQVIDLQAIFERLCDWFRVNPRTRTVAALMAENLHMERKTLGQALKRAKDRPSAQFLWNMVEVAAEQGLDLNAIILGQPHDTPEHSTERLLEQQAQRLTSTLDKHLDERFSRLQQGLEAGRRLQEDRLDAGGV